MFLIRSTFWIALAFVVVQPQGWDIGAQANTLSDTALSKGRALATQQLQNVDCDTIECIGGKAILLNADILNDPLQASPMHGFPSLTNAPIPQPRIKRTG